MAYIVGRLLRAQLINSGGDLQICKTSPAHKTPTRCFMARASSSLSGRFIAAYQSGSLARATGGVWERWMSAHAIAITSRIGGTFLSVPSRVRVRPFQVQKQLNRFEPSPLWRAAE